MNDFRRNDFFISVNKEIGEKKFYIKIRNKKVEVSKDVFDVLYNSYRKEIRDGKRDQKFGLISYDMLLKDEYSLLDSLTANELDIVERLLQKEMYENIIGIISQLNPDDRIFILELLNNKKTEKELATKYNVTQQSINKRKKRIIREIKKNFEKKGC